MIEKTKTYTCSKCDWAVTLEWIKGTVTSGPLFELSRKAPNYGDGHQCKTCGNDVTATIN